MGHMSPVYQKDIDTNTGLKFKYCYGSSINPLSIVILSFV